MEAAVTQKRRTTTEFTELDLRGSRHGELAKSTLFALPINRLKKLVRITVYELVRCGMNCNFKGRKLSKVSGGGAVAIRPERTTQFRNSVTRVVSK